MASPVLLQEKEIVNEKSSSYHRNDERRHHKGRALPGGLEAIGYRKGIRLYTPLQVRTIVDHMGDPENWNL